MIFFLLFFLIQKQAFPEHIEARCIKIGVVLFWSWILALGVMLVYRYAERIVCHEAGLCVHE